MTARLDLRLFINDMLRGTLVHVRMRLELEQEIEDIDQEEYLKLSTTGPMVKSCCSQYWNLD